MHRRFPEIKVSASLLFRTYRKLGIKFKYISKVKRVIDYNLEYFHNLFVRMDSLLSQAKLDNMRIVFLDEAVFTFNTFCSRAWSSRYSQITVSEERLKVKTQALIAGISEEAGLESYLVYPRSISAEEFLKFIDQLSEKLNRLPFAIFLDNLQVHKTEQVRETLRRMQITPIYNIPYSPDFNGIECYFSLVKAQYKKLLLQRMMKGETFETDLLVKQAIARVSDEKAMKCAAFGLASV
jgi:transposase